MKSFVSLQFLILFTFYFCTKCSPPPLSTVAIKSLIRKHFCKKSQRVDVIYFGHNQIDEILYDKNCLIAIKMIAVKNNIPRNWKLTTSSVIIFDSMTTFFVNM